MLITTLPSAGSIVTAPVFPFKLSTVLIIYQYIYTPPTDWDGKIYWTKPESLPTWFVNAEMKYKKIIRVLGATANMIDVTHGTTYDDMPRTLRLMGNLTKHFLSNEFVMMINNYNCVKEFDVTYKNIRELSWYITDALKNPYPNDDNAHVLDLVVELELLLTD